MGKKRIDELEAMARLDEGPEDEDEQASDEMLEMAADEDLDEELDEEFEDDPEIETLLAMAQMDAEAAAAYEAVAELVTEIDVRETLLEFGADHRRHVDAIGELMDERGFEPAFPPPDSSTSVFAVLASSIAGLGTRAALLALSANEEFTNATYDTALDLVTDEGARKILEWGFLDEQRHLRWLAEQADRVEEAEEGRGAEA